VAADLADGAAPRIALDAFDPARLLA
jgi:hypothetical protein